MPLTVAVCYIMEINDIDAIWQKNLQFWWFNQFVVVQVVELEALHQCLPAEYILDVRRYWNTKNSWKPMVTRCWLQVSAIPWLLMSLIKVPHLAVDVDNLFVCSFVHVSAFWPLFSGLFLDHKETYGDWYQPSLLERTSARKHTLVLSAYRSLPLKTEKFLLMTVGKTACTARAMLIVGLRKENNFLTIKAEGKVVALPSHHAKICHVKW